MIKVIDLVNVKEYKLICDLCKNAGRLVEFDTEQQARGHLAEHNILELFTLRPIIEGVVKAPEAPEELPLPPPPEKPKEEPKEKHHARARIGS